MLSRVPFVGFVVCFISGILADEYIIPYSNYNNLVFALFTAMVGASSFYFYFKKADLYFGISLSVFLVMSGALASSLKNTTLKCDLAALSNTKYSAYEAVVKSLPEKRVKSIRLEASTTRIRFGDKWVDRSVRILISIPSNAASIPRPGNYIVVNGNLDRPNKALNPEEFDYQRYLWNKGIVWTDYLPEDSYQILVSKTTSFSPGLYSIEISEWADRVFRDNIKNDRSYGLIKAMLLGRRDDLRSDQVDDYTTSGTVHILSVSGMHVAIIFLVISAALGWMKRWKFGKFAYLASVILMLSFYALVTGLPPSVQRATLMCIVFVIAETFNRKQSAMNTLAISALLILVVDPHALYDVGFQLSFLAMSGIFLLYQPIEIIWKPANPLLKYVWQITAMSFAAQLATFPLSLYYFHQFPFYFWLVNPFVIFFTNFLLPAAMVLLLVSLSNFSWLQDIVNWWVDASAYLTNISVSIPKLLPGYLIENLYLDKMEVTLLYVFLFTVWYGYHKQEYLILKRSAAIACLFVSYSLSISTQSYFSSVAMIHSVPKHSAISFKEGNKLFISSDKAFQADTNAYKFHIKNYAISQGITEPTFISDSMNFVSKNLIFKNLDDGSLLSWKGKLIYYGKDIRSSIPSDYSLITAANPPKVELSEINPKTTFLLGGEIRGKKRDKWMQFLIARKANSYDLSDGYLLLR